MNTTDKIKISQNIILVAGIFCTAVAMLLLLNFWQVSQSDPIESKALEALVQRLKQEPNNEELKVEIRNFDLLARKAYFNSQWQVKTGAYLLLFGAIVLALALRVYYSAKSKIETPDEKLENEIASRIIAQKGILIVGALVLVSALVASFATVNHLDHYDPQLVVAEVGGSTDSDEIEVIEVGTAVTQEPAAEEPAVEQPAEQVIDLEAQEETIEPEPTPASASPTPSASASAPASASFSLNEVKMHHNAFRGPLSQGVIYHKNIPTTWDGGAGTNVIWKSPIPKHGYNSPVIWGDKIFIAGADESSREIYCYNRNDGKLLWTGIAKNIPGAPANPPKVTEDTGLSAPTLTTDGKGVYAIFGTGDIIAFDMNGKRLWARNLGVPDNHYAHSSSLVVWSGKVIVQYDTNRGGKVLALNTSNGETIWETNREAKISWASPVLAEIDGVYQVILASDPIVAGYNTETGEELWKVECLMGEVGPSVGFSNGKVFAGQEYAIMVGIDPKNESIIWEADEYLPEASSVLAHDGLVIIATSYGVLVCYDAETGEMLWEHDVGATFYSSPVVADGKLFMMDNDGVTRVYEYTKEMKLISENELGEMAGATPAFSDGRIYIRGDNHLFCIGN